VQREQQQAKFVTQQHEAHINVLWKGRECSSNLCQTFPEIDMLRNPDDWTFGSPQHPSSVSQELRASHLDGAGVRSVRNRLRQVERDREEWQHGDGRARTVSATFAESNLSVNR
jgi:hypothetical protein